MRTEQQIQEEIAKVEQARRTALKKVDRCLARHAELYKELAEARHESESTK